MQIKTILNRVQKFNSFVYGQVRWRGLEEEPKLEVAVHQRGTSGPLCSGCGRAGPGYDRLDARAFEFVPVWGI
jgi:hypothetical protein